MPTAIPRLQSLSADLHVWSPPQRGWGLANCGLIASAGSAVWIDAPYDAVLARAFREQSLALLAERGAPERIDRVLVTHPNGDHYWGTSAVPDAEVIATRSARDHLRLEPDPQALHALQATADPETATGAYLLAHFGDFDWDGIRPTAPALLIDGELELRVGAVTVLATAMPPAHTVGDLIVHLPELSTVFAGDLIFGSTAERPGDHPVHWAGPLANVIAGGERILATGAETVVPGHGPVLGREDVRAHLRYLEHLRGSAARLHAAGVPVAEAARRVLDEGRNPELGLPERLVVTLGAEYRHLDGSPHPVLLEEFARMTAFAAALRPAEHR
ncbi:MBL fold metallo-hydrolase [Mangrovactinospora gilvigrisea]|uniref:MBL fold metallo-hydrolase n=1 Tax=Mangrovactinospora gilvigrisea TaxID=1428644 RepID=A0A1J7CHG0_9ACTN|nr:MBL fold metallo-hydrolase [Mangrovactinospora gilvigrisea]OIV39074.1 MBL fold metallo-hydrolase [Mangrovactinospora gilvigrisea]